MQPEFGTNIRRSVFEQNTEALQDFLSQDIKTAIKRWLPYIVVNEVAADRAVDKHIIYIVIAFRVTSSGANLVINLMADENKIVVTDLEQDNSVTSLQQIGTFGTY